MNKETLRKKIEEEKGIVSKLKGEASPLGVNSWLTGELYTLEWVLSLLDAEHLEASEDTEEENPCPKTVSGKHMWSHEFIHGLSTTVGHTRKCLACGLIDDTYEEETDGN